MGHVRARVFDYEASLDADELVAGDTRLPLPEDVLPEHLLLAAAARCVLKSLRFYARGHTVAGGAPTMRCSVTRRDDGRYAIVSSTIELDIEVRPPAAEADLPGLLARAEAGCFVGNSLCAKPTYRWCVNGVPVDSLASAR